ncbi:glycerate kinase [Paenibacillus sp. UNCCL117]|uniref:glycerate kinase family protein n=1 Tax=unclassified Paenibacillus TaxID=185978 RepID=UPI00087E90F1|nr:MULTISPECIES: glycerate kinase [unclassified Paenibacillus]SDD89930.1 glycerate kinase [Paenibacillus sp. cl123]SFW44042.1 glycerate kinase [Paenibacillus sp. UNCCL117]
MKVVIAIDSFKGSVTSQEASAAIAEGVRGVYPEADIVSLPVADGGEGTVEALVAASGGRLVQLDVTGPIGQTVTAAYGVLDDGRTAVIETAAACGLTLVPEAERNPLRTTTFGVGEMIRTAVRQGVREFIIGLGGSATNDAGVGMLQALGYRFLDACGTEIGRGGAALLDICSVDSSGALPELQDCRFRVACDVDNPLYGPEGAAHIFASQKGAGPADIQLLDQGLRQWADAVRIWSGADIADVPGAGAAGGLGAAFVGCLGGTLESGIGLMLEMIGLPARLEGAQLVITGEGRLDGQTVRGKVPFGVARLAAKLGVPVVALAGAVDPAAEALNEHGITAYFPIVGGPLPLDQAMNPEYTRERLRTTAGQLLRLLKAAR